MRLLILSDLHLEHGPFEFPTDLPAFDVAVFAGDIHQPITAAIEWLARERDSGALDGRPVVYVAGNHEFYRGLIQIRLEEGERAATAAGIHLLHRRSVEIDGVRFLGCTLWTDYKLYNTPKPSMIHAGHELNDHRLIRYREDTGHISRFMPWHAGKEHRLDLSFLRDELAQPHSGPTVVVTHHAPHPNSIQPRHRGRSRPRLHLRPQRADRRLAAGALGPWARSWVARLLARQDADPCEPGWVSDQWAARKRRVQAGLCDRNLTK